MFAWQLLVRRGARALALGWALLSLWLTGPATAQDLAGLRLNQIQVVGTHNSYHLRPAAAMLKAAMAVRKDAKEWDYSRQTLTEQLDQGVRSFELDLHCGTDDWMVMHVPTFDAGTTVKTFREAIQTIRQWSDAHPRHVPISLLLELKEEGFALSRAFRRPELADLERLDTQLAEVLPRGQRITPDDVRGPHATLPEAIAAGGWPTLAAAAGRVLVILHETGPHREAYLRGHPALEGRAMFVESEPGAPHAAALVLNDPADPHIETFSRQGYLVRTRVDSQGQISAARRQLALDGAAHLLSTDYPTGEIEPDRAFSFPSRAPARVNPVTGPEPLRGQPLSEPLPGPANSGK